MVRCAQDAYALSTKSMPEKIRHMELIPHLPHAHVNTNQKYGGLTNLRHEVWVLPKPWMAVFFQFKGYDSCYLGSLLCVTKRSRMAL